MKTISTNSNSFFHNLIDKYIYHVLIKKDYKNADQLMVTRNMWMAQSSLNAA